ncbi:MAG: peptidoglycan-binding protein, partial [Oscillospiraceae bacterium]|nr:peptidoglycan-binding protein [Oscillospiraceae bacterium]
DRLFASDAPAHEEPTTTTTTTTTAPAAATPPADGDAKETPGDTTAGDSSAQSTTTPDKDESNETTASVQTTTAPAPKYRTLDLGSKGDDVSKLQARLTELGYFDQEITGYYGVFTMDAVKRFQKKIMPYPTGVADEETQERIFADDAPWSADDADLSPMYDDEDALRIDGGEQDDYDENIASESDTPALAPPPAPDSPGIDGLSTRADVSEFIRKYGGNGALETLGIYGASGPKTVVYRGGERIEITPELERVMNECVFY